MKAVIQRVCSASVEVEGGCVSEIGPGLVCLIGIERDDTDKDRDYIIRKILKLRIFPDDKSRMSKSVQDINGQVLLISQFTLYGDCSKGNRPSFDRAMKPDQAKAFYENFYTSFECQYKHVKDGIFGAMMKVSLVNDGPVTIIIES